MAATIRQIYEDMPSVLSVPAALQHKRVEVILLPLDDVEPVKPEVTLDENGWPVGLFEQLTEGWQGEPMVREDQGEYPIRLELE